MLIYVIPQLKSNRDYFSSLRPITFGEKRWNSNIKVVNGKLFSKIAMPTLLQFFFEVCIRSACFGLHLTKSTFDLP